MWQTDPTALTVFFRTSNSLQLTSILPGTCYLAVLWPELQLQCQLGHCL